MARLVTTQAEKAAASYLNWDDAALGKFCKKMALVMEQQRAKLQKKAQDDGLDYAINAADGVLLIAHMIDVGAAKLDLKFGEFTHAGEAAGDWRIRVEQVKKP